VISENTTKEPRVILPGICIVAVDDDRRDVRVIGHQVVLTDDCHERRKRVTHPTEGEGYRCKKDGRTVSERLEMKTDNLSNGLLNNVATDEEEEGEDIAGIRPLRAHLRFWAGVGGHS
jgi:hypothetical protein